MSSSDWREGCERCKQILRYGGMGHTMSIHSRNDEVILQFGLKKPAFRIVVNTPTTLGSIGLTTGLDPSMTLGCGGYGGNITSDNISPRHLLNIKRVAYETTPVATLRPPARPAAERRGAAKGAGAARKRPRHRRRVAGAADRRVPGVARVYRLRRPTAAAAGRVLRQLPQPPSLAPNAARRRRRPCRRKGCGLRLRGRRADRRCGRDARFW